MAPISSDELQRFFSALAPDLQLDDLEVVGVGHDFLTDAYRVAFAWNDRRVTVSFTSERLADIRSGNSFVLRRFRKELHAALGVDEENSTE